jgi:uncharacterized protein (DUF849 family)
MTPPYIMVAPTGARRGKADHPNLPITPEEIAQTARDCARAGADAIHLHVRDAAGEHSLDPERYREAMAAIYETAPELRVQVTTEAAGRFTPDDQDELLRILAPPWASVSLREVAQDPNTARRIYARCAQQGTQVQHIIYDPADADLLRHWQAEDVLGHKESVILVLGRYSKGQHSNPAELAALRSALPRVGRWMVCAFGPQEHTCLQKAAQMGGDIRVGFENSLQDAEGAFWSSNAASVATLNANLCVEP